MSVLMNAAKDCDYTLATFAMPCPDTAACKVDFDGSQPTRFVRNVEPTSVTQCTRRAMLPTQLHRPRKLHRCFGPRGLRNLRNRTGVGHLTRLTQGGVSQNLRRMPYLVH